MKQLKLINNITNEDLFTQVDDEDYERLNFYNWYVEFNTNQKYARATINGDYLRMHQFLMNAKGIDHKDRDGLNNQKGNLRKANHQENGRNIIQSLGVCGYRGVSKNKSSYLARIRDASGKKLHLGSFSTAINAAKAYDLAAIKYHGEFAVLNFPKESYNGAI